ncbi:MAG: thermonuclease family protein [Parasphingorhabdus sp.]
MFKARFSKFRTFLIFVLIIGGALIYQHWIYSEQIILIDGKAAQVIDGDSFRSGGEEFRIYGIDAPEYRQNCKDETGADWSCGQAARNGLDKILRDEDHSCVVRTRDRFGRLVVLCTSETGADLSAMLVSDGLAVSGQSFDETIYATDERNAQKAKRGIWRGKFIHPGVWRAQNPRS